MARKEANLTACMITQELNKDFYASWYANADANEINRLNTIFEAAENEDAFPLTVEICNRLALNNIVVKEAYGVIHKRDEHKIWDEAHGEYILELKNSHFHITCKFEKGGTLGAIAKAICFEPQFIEKPTRGRFAYDNMLSYLIHAKDSEKYPYSPDAVCTVAKNGENVKSYKSIYMERKDDWALGKAKKKTEKAKMSIDWLEEEIIEGRVTKSQIMLTDEYFSMYARNKRRCEDAFDTYAQRKIYKTLREIELGNIKITTIFIEGEPSAGKTTFAKALATKIIEERSSVGEKWNVYDAAASNSADDYAGEEIFLMDDVRGAAMTASDWLRLMDAENASKIAARYKNKTVVSRVIIITASIDPFTFFTRLKDDSQDKEAMSQFIRRITANIKVYRLPDGKRRITIEESHRVPRFLPFAGRVATGTIECDYNFDLLDTDNENLTPNEAIEKIVQTVAAANSLNGANKNPILLDE